MLRDTFGEYKRGTGRLLRAIGDIFAPRICLGCARAGAALCESCFSNIPSPVRNMPDWIHALYAYKSPLIKKSIWRLKYRHTHDVARIYGKALFDRMIEDFSERILFRKETYYLVPIPLSPKRMRERGYNQSALLANAIRACDHSGLFRDGSRFLKRNDSLVRQSHTKNKQGRLKNIVGSFYADREIPMGAHLVIIDDVVTTGATLAEARKALIQAGARKVSAYAIAH